jgi:hypothetical protein
MVSFFNGIGKKKQGRSKMPPEGLPKVDLSPMAGKPWPSSFGSIRTTVRMHPRRFIQCIEASTKGSISTRSKKAQ